MNRICDSRSHRCRRTLAAFLSTKGSLLIRSKIVKGTHIWHVKGRGETVVTEVRIKDPAFICDVVLIAGISHAHSDGALKLTFNCAPVKRASAVMCKYKIGNVYAPCFLIHKYMGCCCRETVCRSEVFLTVICGGIILGRGTFMTVGAYTRKLVTAVYGHIFKYRFCKRHLKFSSLPAYHLAFKTLKSLRHYTPHRCNYIKQLNLGINRRTSCSISRKEGNTASIGTGIKGSGMRIRYYGSGVFHVNSKLLCHNGSHGSIRAHADVICSSVNGAVTYLIYLYNHACGRTVGSIENGEAGTRNKAGCRKAYALTILQIILAFLPLDLTSYGVKTLL